MQDYKIIRSSRKTIAIQVDESGEVIVRAPYFCSRRKIDGFVQSKNEWIIRAQQKQNERTNRLCNAELSVEQIKLLKKTAKSVLNDKVIYYSALMGVEPAKVTITSARKRFGSCNSKGNICFSYRLMLYPEEAIDYVVVHELAHLTELNHSKSFYDIVRNVLPDYRDREKLLKQ